MTRVYYKYAIAAIIGTCLTKPILVGGEQPVTDPLSRIVFDLSRPATFEAVAKVRFCS